MWRKRILYRGNTRKTAFLFWLCVTVSAALLQLACNELGTILTAGLKCCDIGGPATCQGMIAGTSGSKENRYLCNQVVQGMRHYVSKYYNASYFCEECQSSTKVET